MEINHILKFFPNPIKSLFEGDYTISLWLKSSGLQKNKKNIME